VAGEGQVQAAAQTKAANRRHYRDREARDLIEQSLAFKGELARREPFELHDFFEVGACGEGFARGGDDDAAEQILAANKVKVGPQFFEDPARQARVSVAGGECENRDRVVGLKIQILNGEF